MRGRRGPPLKFAPPADDPLRESHPDPLSGMQRYPHDRAHYRIEYPPAARPTFLPAQGDRPFPVVDCCERGLRFAPDGPAARGVAPGAGVRGELRFRDGETLQVSGVVVRIQADEVAVHLNEEPIPLKRILFEQILLRRRYPCRTA